MKTILAWIGGLALVVAAGAFAVTLASVLAPPRVLQTCTQPDSIVYTPGRTFEVYRRSTGLPWIAEGHDANIGSDPSYGVALRLSSAGTNHDFTCEWTDQGVTIVEFGGISHVVPTDVFVGGR